MILLTPIKVKRSIYLAYLEVLVDIKLDSRCNRVTRQHKARNMQKSADRVIFVLSNFSDIDKQGKTTGKHHSLFVERESNKKSPVR